MRKEEEKSKKCLDVSSSERGTYILNCTALATMGCGRNG